MKVYSPLLGRCQWFPKLLAEPHACIFSNFPRQSDNHRKDKKIISLNWRCRSWYLKLAAPKELRNKFDSPLRHCKPCRKLKHEQMKDLPCPRGLGLWRDDARATKKRLMMIYFWQMGKTSRTKKKGRGQKVCTRKYTKKTNLKPLLCIIPLEHWEISHPQNCMPGLNIREKPQKGEKISDYWGGRGCERLSLQQKVVQNLHCRPSQARVRRTA